MSSKCLVCMRWFIAGDIKVINDSGATIHQKCEQRKLPKIVQTEGCTLENVERWMCYKCTFAHNHPLSSHCDTCLSLRHSKDETSLCCMICDIPINENNRYQVAPDCPPTCKLDAANWMTIQIKDGKSTCLMCPCNKHRMVYLNFMELKNDLAPDIITIYMNSLRRSNIPVCEIEIECPECSTKCVAVTNQTTYLCSNPRCPIWSVPICCKHNERYSRRNAEMDWERGMIKGHRTCVKCEIEGGDGLVCSVIQRIENELCDRCPQCKGCVGEPEDFNSCMALRCNHCPSTFCGFCYAYAGDWSSAHAHVRTCPQNPRENYFVEAECIWRDIQKQRKLRLTQIIIDSYGTLTWSQIHIIETCVRKFID